MMCCSLLGAIAPASGSINPWWVTILLLSFLLPACVGVFVIREGWLRRIGILLCITTALVALQNWWLFSSQPVISTQLAVAQLNGGNGIAEEIRLFEATKNDVQRATELIVFLTVIGCFSGYIKTAYHRLKNRKATVVALLGLVTMFTTSGCIKPFDRPEYVEIDTSETGFLIPLDGDSGQQAKFQSEDYLKQRKVATKRVQITHRWSQEGRWETEGRWIPNVRLVKVNRSPVTREWTTEQTTLAGAQSHRSDKAIWIESGDSVGFSMGFNCTAFIAEDEAAKFLYWYPSGSLADVMDHEVRGRIQQVAAEVAAKYPLDALRSRKQEIADAVKKDVTNFFLTRGVTITTVGMFGGMTYENPEIQRSIDQTFIAQQLKVVAEAKFEAQKKENDRIELEANAVAEKARREAMGLADARKTAADAEAEAIRKVNQALNEAKQNPLLYQIRVLDVEKARVEKWDGKYPTYFLGGSSNPNLMLQMPTVEPVGNK